MSKSIRIRTNPGESKNIEIKIEQDFDFLEIMSLKISQQDLYTSFCANYGVVVGRVIANDGLGVPNSKVSVFVPISSEDEKNTLIKDLYPYKAVTSKKKSIRYNLLLSKVTCDLNTSVGTFPSKEEVLNNEIMIEIFDKYYKYTTKTNDSGDYMIFGVPTGQQTVHMDVDLSDAGTFSVRPYDFIDSGYSEKLFESRTKFKKSKNLNILPQIKSGDKGVNVIPFWGEEEQCQIGITRVDFDTNFFFQPSSILVGSIYTDSAKNSLNKRCNPTNDQGDHNELRTGPGLLEVIRVNEYTYDTPEPVEGSKIVPVSLEEFTLPQGPTSVDDDGAFVVTVPMNLGHVITDEFGNLVPSLDPNKGVPTKGMYRFKLAFLEPPAAPKRRTAQLIFPSLNRSVGGTPINQDSQVGTNTQGTNNATENARWSDNLSVWKNSSNELIESFYMDFHEFEFNQVYSISQYITKYKKGGDRWSFLGLKDIDNAAFNLFPMTTVIKGFDILYLIMRIILPLMAAFMKILILLSNFELFIRLSIFFRVLGVTIINQYCKGIKFKPFGFLKGLDTPKTLSCESDPSFPITIDNWTCSEGADIDECEGCPSFCIRIGVVVPVCNPNLIVPQIPGDLPVIKFNCSKYCAVDAWLCCALLDLAKDRGVIKYTFHDAWLTGSAYLPQFKYKSKLKGNGTTKDKFCGPGGDKSGSDNYKNQRCCERGGDGFPTSRCNKCVVRGPSVVDKDKGNGYHQNDYDTGASDTGDMIVCPETYPMKIVNLGRLDACPDVIDRIDRCITSQDCLLELFNNQQGCSATPGAPLPIVNTPSCNTGTYYEEGYDTEQWVNDIGSTSYQDPSLILLKFMTNCGLGIEQMFNPLNCGVFNNSCGECEINDNVYQQIRQVSKIYTDIILTPEPNPPSLDPSLDLVVFEGFEADVAQAQRFHPSAPQGFNDTDTEVGDRIHRHHTANTPYFYFGLIAGRTAMDKLRKDYLN